MNFYSVIITSHNLSKSIKCLQKFQNNLFTRDGIIIRKYSKLAEKINQNKSYVSVEIAEKTNVGVRKNIAKFFRKNPTIEKKVTKGLNRSEFKRLLTLAKPEKWKLLGAVGFLLVSSTVTMVIPFSLGKVLDIIYMHTENTDEAKAKLNTVCGALLCIFVLGAACNFARIYFMSTAGYRMTNSLRTKVFNSILKQEQGWFDKRSTGELINRLSADTQIVGTALSMNISDGLRSLVMVCAGTGMMFYMSTELALVGLAIVPPIAGVAVVYGRFVRNISKKLQDSLAESTKVAEERIANIRTVKSFAQEPREIESYNKSILDVLTLGYKEAKARALFFSLTGFGGHIIIISVLYYGGVLVTSHTLTVGNLSSFLLYAAYIGVSVGGLSGFYSDINKSVGAATRVWEIIDRNPAIPIDGGNIPLKLPEGRIEFKDVRFSYPARNDIEIFKNLNLRITPGQNVAVVGPSGSGKSTLAALLLRLYDPLEGGIYLDNYNIKDLDPAWVKRHIGTVSQEPILFSCSIRENILYGADDPEKITEEQLLKVSQEANVSEFVQQLPEGFDTVVGERGIMLSGGQKQRVAIARALIKDPKILLLDEATSALDAQSEHLVQEALERVLKGRTVLTIAHRLSTIQNADVIAVLQNGQIVEQGTYQDLCNRHSSIFKELVKHQTFKEFLI